MATGVGGLPLCGAPAVPPKVLATTVETAASRDATVVVDGGCGALGAVGVDMVDVADDGNVFLAIQLVLGTDRVLESAAWGASVCAALVGVDLPAAL